MPEFAISDFAARDAATCSGGRRRVLLVNDHTPSLSAVRRVLRAANPDWAVMGADSATAALRQLAAWPQIDAIVVGAMPDADMLLERVRRHYRGVVRLAAVRDDGQCLPSAQLSIDRHVGAIEIVTMLTHAMNFGSGSPENGRSSESGIRPAARSVRTRSGLTAGDRGRRRSHPGVFRLTQSTQDAAG